MAPLITVSGIAGSPVEYYMHAPAQLLPGSGPLSAGESENQADPVPAAALRMVRWAFLVLTR